MNDHRYTPPKAYVADVVEQGASSDAPSVVRLAIRLCWISLGLGLVNVVVTVWRLMGPDFSWPVLVGGMIGGGMTILITVWLVLKVSVGRNWARITMVVLAVISTPYFGRTLPATFKISFPEGMLFLVVYGLQYVALVLLFVKESQHWFRQKKAPSPVA